MITVIAAIVMFAVLIFVHEFGHFIAAKACDVQVNQFALGMGPAIFKKKGKETEYSLRVFPIGGFCEMEGEMEDSEAPRAFNNKKAWQKAVIIAAGPIMNVLLALFIMIFLLWQMGVATTTIASVVEDSPAEAAGIKAGDTLISIDGASIDQWDDISGAVEDGGDELEIVLERDGEKMTVTCGTMESGGRSIIGITPEREKNIGQAFVDGPKATWQLTKEMYVIIKQLITGEISTENLSGPVGIVYMVNETAKTGLLNFIYLVALLSLNLAVVNLLPFPALDGGRLAFILIRKVTGKRITDEMEAKVNFVGLMLLFGLMIYVTWNDIVRFIAPLF